MRLARKLTLAFFLPLYIYVRLVFWMSRDRQILVE